MDNTKVEVVRIDGSDKDIALAARISYGKQYIKNNDVRRMIENLFKLGHMTPFEFGSMWFNIRCSRACHSQFLQYRTATRITRSHRRTKPIELDENIQDLDEHTDACLKKYQQLLDLDVSREDARGVLPMDTLTDFHFKMDIRNLLHFFNERTNLEAQAEIRSLAYEMLGETELAFPYTITAWKKYRSETR